MNIKNIICSVIPNNPVAQPVTMATYWEDNGIRYPLKKNEVFFRSEEVNENMSIAQWFTTVTGRTIQLQPIVLNPKGIKTCDFILTDDNTKLELKTFAIDPNQYDQNKNYINKKIGTGYGQANDFIIDITGTPITVQKAIADLDDVMHFSNRLFVKRVYLKSDNSLVGVFERK